MLTATQKEAIQRINILETFTKTVNGRILTPGKKDIIVPTFFEIKKSILNKLQPVGLTTIECVKPYRANCIIRVYQNLDYQYESLILSVYGVKCYVKVNNIWTTADNSKIDFSSFTLRQYFFQDEYIDHNCEFFDCYVKIR